MRAEVQKRIESRVDWLKVFATRSGRAGGTATHSLEQLQWAMDEAKKAGIPVSTHAHAPEGARRAILAGTRTLEHGALLTDDVLDLMVERNIYYSPNLYLGDVPAAVEFGRVAAAPVNTLRQQPHRCQEISVCF